jgi:hypothetical protein
MKTSDEQPEDAGFRQMVSMAMTRLKQRLQHDYEQAYPELREIIHLVLDEEERNAWEFSLFPHLLLPDLVEARVAKLNLHLLQIPTRISGPMSKSFGSRTVGLDQGEIAP